MKADRENEWFQARFGEMKGRDRAEAPGFEGMVRAERARRRGWDAWMTPMRVAAAVAVVAISAVGMWLARPHGGQQTVVKAPPSPSPDPKLVAMEAEVLIADWRSPTDFLLEMPDVAATPVTPATSPSNGNVGAGELKKHF